MPSAPTYDITVESGDVYAVTVDVAETSYTVDMSAGPTYTVEMQLGTGPAGPPGAQGPPGADGTGTVNSVAGISPDGAGNVPLTPASIGAQPAGSYATAAQGAKADTAVQPARKFSTAAGSGLLGGGDLSADRSLAADWGTTAGKVAQGNDSRFIGVPVSTQASTYTLVATDAGSIVEINSASAVNVTIPASLFSAGQIVEVCQYGAGQVTLVAGSGVTLRNAGGLKIAAQYGSASIRFRSATEAVVSGSMTT